MDGSVTEWPKGVQLRAPTVLPSNSLSLQLYHPNPRNSLHQSLTGYPFPPSSHALYHSCGRRTGNISPTPPEGRRLDGAVFEPEDALTLGEWNGQATPPTVPCVPFLTMHSCTRPGHAHESPPARSHREALGIRPPPVRPVQACTSVSTHYSRISRGFLAKCSEMCEIPPNT